MFEELGMPILHNGACTNKTLCPDNFFWEYVPKEQYFTGCQDEIKESCNAETLYPVDLWLYDHRTTLSVKNDDFAVAFPDKAIVSGQMEFWPIGGRLITPFHAAKILDIVGESVATADRLHLETECVANVDVSSTEHKKNGIAPGSYACYAKDFHNDAYFKRCVKSTGEDDKAHNDKDDVDKAKEISGNPDSSLAVPCSNAYENFLLTVMMLVVAFAL